MRIVLFETKERHDNLLPLSFTRPVACFRVGITTIAEKWQAIFDAKAEFIGPDYLNVKYPAPEADCVDAIFIAGHVLPDSELEAAIGSLLPGQAIIYKEECIAFRGSLADFEARRWNAREWSGEIDRIEYVFDIFLLNGKMIRRDFEHITRCRESQPVSESCVVLGPRVDADGRPMLFIEEGASVEGAFLNLNAGPIYIGRDAEVMEGSCLRGPIAVCENAHVNMGAKIYPDTTLGPWCKAGGEINNVVMFGYSNKSHDGFLGNAVIGEWCNIGAGVNASNLKNDYSKIRVWNYATRSFMRTDLQFCGLIMGDHSKIGINVMLNTATVMGVGVNLHGSGFPRTFIPSFSAGSPGAGFTEVTPKKFNDIAARAMSRRSIELAEEDLAIFDAVREVASSLRR